VRSAKIPQRIPTLKELGLPPVLEELTKLPRSGSRDRPDGFGQKSTTSPP